MASKIAICNDALAELPADPIQSLDEASLAARECRRAYPLALEYLLEQHDWTFANARVALAAITNGRTGEWLYAYALPADNASPLRILPAVAFATYPAWPFAGVAAQIPYVVAAGVLYTHQVNAVLEYALSDIEPSKMPAMFARALALEIAARTCMTITKSRQLKGDLIKQAEVARERAIADDLNRSPRPQPEYVSEMAALRDGSSLLPFYGLPGPDGVSGGTPTPTPTPTPGYGVLDGRIHGNPHMI